MIVMEHTHGLMGAIRDEFGPDWMRIGHALAVRDYAIEIAASTGADPKIVNAAGFLHDIAIARVEKERGHCTAADQEREGPPIARRILATLQWPEEEIRAVCEIIAHHHTGLNTPTPAFNALWDADWLVNVSSDQGARTPAARQTILKQQLRTETGWSLAKQNVIETPFRYRAATAADIALLRKLADEIWHSNYRNIISEQQVDYMLNWMYAPDKIKEELRIGTIWVIVEINGSSAGYLSLKPEMDTQRLYLSKIYLKSDWQGRGFGQRMLTLTQHVAIAKGLSRIYLHVNRGNEAAIKAYQRAEYRVTGERCLDIGEGFVMDDYEMGKPLPGATS